MIIVVYYEWRKRELKIRLMNEGRCDESHGNLMIDLLFIINRESES
jgi:hypothetical protein